MRKEPDLSHVESGWVTENKKIEQEEKELSEPIRQSLKNIRALFFDNPKNKPEDPAYVADNSTPRLIENMYEGAMSILRDEKTAVLASLDLTDHDWDRVYQTALEIATRYRQDEKQAQQKAV